MHIYGIKRRYYIIDNLINNSITIYISEVDIILEMNQHKIVQKRNFAPHYFETQEICTSLHKYLLYMMTVPIINYL